MVFEDQMRIMDVKGLAQYLTHSKQIELALKQVVASWELQAKRKVSFGPKCWQQGGDCVLKMKNLEEVDRELGELGSSLVSAANLL